MPRTLALSLLCVALATPATAEIYRWTDANGAIHFSDTPPKQKRHASVDVRPTVTVPMSENIRQADKVRQSRAEVDRLLEPGSSSWTGFRASSGPDTAMTGATGCGKNGARSVSYTAGSVCSISRVCGKL